MSDSYYQIAEVLKERENERIKILEIKIVLGDGKKFEHRAMPLRVFVTDGILTVESFRLFISGNQKEVHADFTVDAFLEFAANATIQYGYGESLSGFFTNVNVHLPIPLSATFASTSFINADNNWLTNP